MLRRTSVRIPESQKEGLHLLASSPNSYFLRNMSSGVCYEVAKLLKQADNRLCADCQAPLADANQTYASLKYGVWICESCAQAHYKVLVEPESSRLKKAIGAWLKNEIAIMQAAKSNAVANTLYERYVPYAWTKITPNATLQERKQWIQAKYYSQYFTIPQTAEQKKGKRKDRSKRIDTVTTLPTRIVDFFLVLGMGKLKVKETSKLRYIEDVNFSIDILDCYPRADSYPETPIPELVGPMVFPTGLKISKTELPPFGFTFVLTDINRVKLFGSTLIVYELIEKEKLESSLGAKLCKSLLDSNQVYYAPKALTVLSHYPFYTLFSKFLEQLYHVSLSTSPLPLERYVANFTQELPLPPHGRVEVLYTLPQLMLQISRPPQNHLPMVDFSYRPLFAFLSVDNILTLFTCLCMEMTICVCASNIALLTPVLEALLSFLFPFVWQGCYVPILPAHMLELLDAPVPLLVGMQDHYLLSTPPHARPPNVVFVHLDTDSIFYGTEEELINSKPMVQPPKSKADKLREKLRKFGGCIHRKDIELYQKAGFVFPNNEHLVPISEFLFEQGVLASAQHKQGVFSSVDIQHSHSKLGIVTRSNKNSKDSEAVPYRHPAASTLVYAHNNAYSHSEMNPNNILDPEFNMAKDEGSFNALELREAFLRFFVASFMDYQDFLVGNGPAGNKPSGSTKKSIDAADTSKKEPRGRGLSQILGLTMETMKQLERAAKEANDSGAEPKKKVVFNKEAFATHLQDDFLGKLVESQMFSNFMHERCNEQEQVEITFFNENILAKKNRSMLNVSKNSTPFLSDESDYLRETFSVPVPNTTGLQNNSKFSYGAFPGLSASQIGNVRKAKVLVKGPELKRIEGEAVSTFIRDQMAQLIAGKDVKAEGAENTTEEAEVSQEQFFEIARNRFVSTCHAITTFQQAFRGRKYRLQYKRTLRAILTVQCMYARYKRRRLQRLRVYNKQCIRIQTAFRRHRAMLQVVAVRRAIVRLQALLRRHREVKRYRRLKSAAYAIRNSVMAFYLVRKLRKMVSHEFKQALMLLTYLYLFPQDYGDHSCSMVYKSAFLLNVRPQTSLVYLQVIYDELERVYFAVGLSNPRASCFLSKQKLQSSLASLRYTHASNFSDLTRPQKVTLLLSLDIMQRLHMLNQSSPTVDVFGKITMLINEFLQKTLPPDTLHDQADRQELYRIMKTQQTGYRYTYDDMFSKFPLSGNKKRKQALAQLVWRCTHPDHVQQSCQAVLTLHARERYHRMHPEKKEAAGEDELRACKAQLVRELATVRVDERVRGQVQNVLRACLHSLNRRVHTVHSTGSQKSSLSNHTGKR